MAWAPPTAYTSSMPSSAHAARIVGCGSPPNSFCGRGGQRDRLHPGHLRRHDVHHHAGHQRRDAARDVEPDALDRHHHLADRATGDDLRGDVLLELGLAGGAQPPDRLLQAGPDGRVELARGRRGSPRRAPRCRSARRRRTSRSTPRSPRPPMAHVVADRAHDVEGGLDVEVGAGHDGAVVGGAASPEVDAADHAPV